MDQSLQQGLATQTESIEEELSSLVAICVMMMRGSCHQINLGLCGQLLQYVCVGFCVLCIHICSGVFTDQPMLHGMCVMCSLVCVGVCAGQVTVRVFLAYCSVC